MTTTSRPLGPLRIVNHAGTPARLRFRCAGFPIWDTWIDAGGSITVPAPDDKELQVCASLLDVRSGVAYSAPSALASRCTRVVGMMTCDDGAGRFTVAHEPLERAGHIAMLNLTATELHFSLRFLDSPFHLKLAVAPQAEQLLALAAFDIAVTLDGMTLAAVPIRTWPGDAVISAACIDGQKFPQLKLSAHAPHGL